MIAEISTGSGIELNALAQHFNRTCRRLKAEQASAPPPGEPVTAHYLTRVSEVLREWFNDRTYCSDTGQPDVLPWTGERSLKALIRRATPEADARTVRDVLLHSGAVRREGRRYRAVRRLVSTTGDMKFALMQGLTSVRGYLRSILHNVSCTDPADRLPERKTASLSIPLREVIPIRQLTQHQLGQTLEALDDALWQRSVPLGSEPTTSVHIGIYAYEEPMIPLEELQGARTTQRVERKRNAPSRKKSR